MILPKIFSIETSLLCNLKCIECALGTNIINRKRKYMDFVTFNIIAEKIKPYAEYIFLHVWGEPLLNPEIKEIITCAKKVCRCHISTNGHNISNDLAEFLVKSGVDITISVDGAFQETYEKYRVGGNLEEVWDSINKLVIAKKTFKTNSNINAQFIVFKHNENEMDEFLKKCKDIDVMGTFKAPYLRKNSILEKPSLKEYQRENYSNLSKNKMKGCRDLTDVFTIYVDGSVILCCYDHNGEITLGNILNNSVQEIYNNEITNDLRNKILSGNAPEFCLNNCLTYLR